MTLLRRFASYYSVIWRLLIGDLLAAYGKPSDSVRAPEESDDAIRAIRMFKSQFESFLRRFEADWAAERDTEPPAIDDGNTSCKPASSEILSFKSEIVKDDGGLTAILQDALKSLKVLARYELWLDGGISYREFWEKGNRVLENLKKIPGILEETLGHASQDSKLIERIADKPGSR